MDTNGNAAIPEGFRYRDIYLQGRPRHDRYDDFSIRHPRMDVGRRAKIFAPFDALRGFSAQILAKEAENGRESERAEEDENI